MPTTLTGTSLTVGSIDLTTPLATADGGSKLAQIVTYQTGAVATGTTVAPNDNTILQSTEGDQYMTLAITPTNVNSTLEIEVIINLNHSVGSYMQAGLFQDSIANALAVAYGSVMAGAYGTQLHLKHYMTAASIASTTFKVRAGSNNGATTTFNGQSGGQIGGGVLSSRITIKEYLP